MTGREKLLTGLAAWVVFPFALITAVAAYTAAARRYHATLDRLIQRRRRRGPSTG